MEAVSRYLPLTLEVVNCPLRIKDLNTIDTILVKFSSTEHWMLNSEILKSLENDLLDILTRRF